jgi:hypothetical protein
LGIGSDSYKTLSVAPDLPSKLQYFTTENLMFNNVKYDLTVSKNFIAVSAARGNVDNMKIKVKLKVPEKNYKVYVNGNRQSDFTVENGFVIVVVPFGNVNVSVV